MERLKIIGGKTLSGSLDIQGAKNSVLPILAASILVDGESRIQNCPDLKDVAAAIKILRHLGCTVTRTDKDVYIDSSTLSKSDIPDNLMREMRSSVIFLGAILGRTGEATLSMPGGCELGPRPIDLHLAALRTLGADIEETGGEIACQGKRLRGCKIHLENPSVGATENAMLAAVCARGETVISNAAREPEIEDLQNFLVSAGCRVRGAGSPIVVIEGTKARRAVVHEIIPDRIVAATYLSAVAAAGGKVRLKKVIPAHLKTVTDRLEETGCRLQIGRNEIVMTSNKPLKSMSPVITRPYPDFPTDAQPPLLASVLCAMGTTVFIENIFENRYRYVDELRRMGADVTIEGRVAMVSGVKRLQGAVMSATDLRGGAALVVAALGAEGESTITEIEHIERGYDAIADTLRSIGADIWRLEDEG